MPEIYEHQIPHRRMLNFAYGRICEIDEQVKQLQLEKELMQTILEKFEPLVCPDCMGDGHIMKPIKGCELDGPRLHHCETCDGKGVV